MLSLILVFYCGPRWGKTNMLVYISICSLIGSLSVVFTQGLGGAIVHSFTVENQFTNWFVYFVLVTTLVTLAIEIIYLNKALNLFNTAVVTPTYYVTFTTLTIVSSIVFYRGFDASPVNIVTCVFGFLIICSGVALLQNSRSEKGLDNDDASSHMERLLPVYDDEKFLSSNEDVNHIENITGEASTSDVDHHRASAVRNDSSSLWRRSRGSIDYNDGFADNISLNTIKGGNSGQNSGTIFDRLNENP